MIPGAENQCWCNTLYRSLYTVPGFGQGKHPLRIAHHSKVCLQVFRQPTCSSAHASIYTMVWDPGLFVCALSLDTAQRSTFLHATCFQMPMATTLAWPVAQGPEAGHLGKCYYSRWRTGESNSKTCHSYSKSLWFLWGVDKGCLKHLGHRDLCVILLYLWCCPRG